MEPAGPGSDADRTPELGGPIGVGELPLISRSLAGDRRLWFAVPVGVVAVAAMIASLLWQSEAAARRERDANAWSAHALEVLIVAAQFQAALSDTERGASGFVQTGDVAFRDVYGAGAAGLQTHLARLRAMTADNPAQERRLAGLAGATTTFLALERQAIAIDASGAHAAAIRLIAGREADAAVRRARQAVGDVVGEEQRLVAARQAASRRAGAQTALFARLLALVGGVTLMLAGALGALALFASARTGMAMLRARANDRLASTGALLSLFIADAPAAIAMFDVKMRYLAVSQRYVTDFGLPPESQLVGRSHDDILPDIPDRWREIHARVLSGETLSHDEDAFPRADGRVDWVRWRMEPWRGGDGRIGGALLFSEVITAQVEAQRAHRAAEARLRAIVDTAADAILVIDEEGVIQSANAATTAMFGYAEDELVGRNVAILMPEPDRSAHDGYLAAYRRTGQRRIPRQGREVEALRRDGSRLTVDLAVAEWRDGETRYFTGLLRDVTSRKAAEAQRQLAERRELVVGELRHRINNMFAVINSLVLATARSRSDVADYRDTLLARIAAFGAAQIELARQGWSSRSLRDIIDFELRPFREGSRVSVDGPSVRLKPSAAENFSMIVHELATNAVKYGALSRPEGRLLIGWRLALDEQGVSRLRFEWSEADGPAVSPPNRTGFGTTVIETGARALGGAFEMRYEPEGFRCSIDAPAARNLAEEPPAVAE